MDILLNILIAEDDENVLKHEKEILLREGYDVLTAANGKEALEKAYSHHIDLILLDVLMPEMDGIAFTTQYRRYNDRTPILMLSEKGQPADRCEGLSAGADDYMTKPVYEQELLLRIKALLRRAQIFSEHVLKVGSAELDYDKLLVTVNGVSQTLPKKEFYLIYKLLSYPEKIFSRAQLMDEIWGMDNESGETTINVHINRLRNRFADCRDFEIVAIRGVGYKAVVKC